MRRQLEVLKGDVLALRRLWEHVVRVMESRTLDTRYSLEDLGVQRKGFLVRGSADHVQISSTKEGKPTEASWKDLGAQALARLGEKLLRRVFGGEVVLDKETGAIEVLYDFSESAQLRDWLTVRQLGVRGAGWRVSGGKVVCSGADTLLMWKFPIKSADFQADLTFDDPEGRALFSAKITKASPKGVLGWMRGGYLGFISGSRHLTYRRTADAYYIWRKGETATIRYYARGDERQKYFEIELNGERLGYTYDSRDTGPRPGRIAFGFEKSRGTVDNVLIRGTLDMEWFSANVKGFR